MKRPMPVSLLVLWLVLSGCASRDTTTQTYEYAVVESIRIYGYNHVVIETRDAPDAPLDVRSLYLYESLRVYEDVPAGQPKRATLRITRETSSLGCVNAQTWTYAALDVHVRDKRDLIYMSSEVERTYTIDD